MAQCHNCGTQVVDGAAACPECGVQFSNQGQGQHQQGQAQGQPQQGQQQYQGGQQAQQPGPGPAQVQGAGSSGPEAIGALIAVLSVIYALMNLVGVAGAFILSSAANQVGASGAAGASAIFGIIWLLLTIGFVAGAIGTFTQSDWGWPLMAGTWGVNLVWSVFLLTQTEGGADILAVVFWVINAVVLGWIISKKRNELPVIGTGQNQPVR
jgi:hypothetical protein